MLKRLRWVAYGAVAGSIGTIFARRRLTTRLNSISGRSLSGDDVGTVDRIAGVAVTGARGAGRQMGSLLHSAGNAVKDAARVGKEEARGKETEMWEDISRRIPRLDAEHR
jgi:hypothetical protein